MKKDNKLIDRVKFSLKDMAFNDIKRASVGGSKMGAFVLSSCFIDYLAGFYCGHKSNRDDYINFTNKYLYKYDGYKIYHSVRCGLVHNYSVERDFVFSYNLKDGEHLSVHKSGRLILNLEDFINDIEIAMNKYFKALDYDKQLRDNAIARMKRGKVLGIISDK